MFAALRTVPADSHGIDTDGIDTDDGERGGRAMDGGSRYLAERCARWEARKAGWGGPIFHGRARPGPDDLVLFSNDYLALGGHPRVIAAQTDSLARQGNGLMMSGVYAGERDPAHELEERLAAFLGAPATMLCQSGWSANVGLIGAIAAPEEPVYIDALAHGSLWAGIEAAQATPRPFPHHDIEYLELLIRRHGPGLIAVDTLYSVTGDLCPLAEFVEVAEQTGCRLIADESHALGVLGPHGAGLAAALGLSERVDFRTASLAKAFAGRAGLIACPRPIARYLPFHAHGAVFSSTLLPHDVAGLAAVLDLVIGADDRRHRLAANAEAVRDGLTVLGYAVAPSTSQIIPLQPGSEREIARFQGLLDTRGVFGAAFIPPAVARDRCVHRLSVHSELDAHDVTRILDACATVREESGMPDWKSTRRLRAARPEEVTASC